MKIFTPPSRNTGYVKPEQARSPQDLVRVDRILIDGGENDVSIARGAWDSQPCLLIRWNGSKDEPQGFPNPRGWPAWHVIPDWMADGVMSALAKRIVEELDNAVSDQP